MTEKKHWFKTVSRRSKTKQTSALAVYSLLWPHLNLHVRMKHTGALRWLKMQMRRWKINFTFLTFWTDNTTLPHLASKFLLSQTRAWNRFPHESTHLPAARWWKLALRGGIEVYCCVEPARGSLIKLSPGSWNVISSFVIQARIICLHFACDGLLDHNVLGPNDAEAMLMVEGSQRSQTATKKKKKPSDLSHLEIGNHP